MRHRRRQGPASAGLLTPDIAPRVARRSARARRGPRGCGAPCLRAAGRRDHLETTPERHHRGGERGREARRPPVAQPSACVATHPRGRRRDAPATRGPRGCRCLAAQRTRAALPGHRDHLAPPDTGTRRDRRSGTAAIRSRRARHPRRPRPPRGRDRPTSTAATHTPATGIVNARSDTRTRSIAPADKTTAAGRASGRQRTPPAPPTSMDWARVGPPVPSSSPRPQSAQARSSEPNNPRRREHAHQRRPAGAHRGAGGDTRWRQVPVGGSLGGLVQAAIGRPAGSAAAAGLGRAEIAMAASAPRPARTEQAQNAGLNPAVTVAGLPRPP